MKKKLIIIMMLLVSTSMFAQTKLADTFTIAGFGLCSPDCQYDNKDINPNGEFKYGKNLVGKTFGGHELRNIEIHLAAAYLLDDNLFAKGVYPDSIKKRIYRIQFDFTNTLSYGEYESLVNALIRKYNFSKKASLFGGNYSCYLVAPDNSFELYISVYSLQIEDQRVKPEIKKAEQEYSINLDDI